MKSLYNALVKQEKVRENLSQLKAALKKKSDQVLFEKITKGQYDFLMRYLVHEDPKVRKNAAGVLGTLRCQDALDVLWDAYEAEDTRFVRADYIKAMAQLDCKDYLPEFRKQLKTLTEIQAKVEEKKHLQEEIKELQELLLAKDEVKKHRFIGQYLTNEVVLTTLPVFRTVTARQIQNAPVSLIGAGVKTKTNDLNQILEIRTFKELLFVLSGVKTLQPKPEQIVEGLLASNMMEVIRKNHEGDGPFFFRLGIVGNLTLEEKGVLTKKVAAALEEATDRALINSASHYELEIRLMANKDGEFYPFLRFYTLPDNRFAYRKHHVSTGMQPYIAAGLLKLAEGYVKEHGQVLDPVCGTGTLLVERNYLKPTRSAYGVDIFGEAIDKARINTKIAKMNINYINRNFKDFSHEYLFDEILADMPQKGALSFDDLDVLYQKLFERAGEWLNPNGLLMIYSNEIGLVKKQIRLREKFKLEQEFCISEKQKQYFYVVRYQ